MATPRRTDSDKGGGTTGGVLRPLRTVVVCRPPLEHEARVSSTEIDVRAAEAQEDGTFELALEDDKGVKTLLRPSQLYGHRAHDPDTLCKTGRRRASWSTGLRAVLCALAAGPQQCASSSGSAVPLGGSLPQWLKCLSPLPAEVEPLLLAALKGESGAIIAYGATGSGKSFVMGTEALRPEMPWSNSVGQYVPRRLWQLATDQGLALTVQCAMVEVYRENRNEQLFDLLSMGRRRVELSDPGLWHATPDAAALTERLVEGSLLRNTDRTDGNSRSSRSHAIFIIKVGGRPCVAAGQPARPRQ